MTSDQITIFAILGLTLALFIWNRWRYDIVAMLALLAVAGFGLVPSERIFVGFGHPAVVTVMAVLVLSHGLFLAGAVDNMARALARVGQRPSIQVAALTGIVALSSGIMNNVGALALLMPVAVWMSRQSGRSPSLLLMPLAFGSLLGGTLTMIGTPPNIIIASYREHTGAPSFGMFDFLPVGGAITLTGLAFIALAGWRLTPKRIREGAKKLFRISDYLTEVRVPESSRLVGQPLHNLLSIMEKEGEVIVTGLVRGEIRQQMPSIYEVLQTGDILLVEADAESLKSLIDLTGLELAESGKKEGEKEKRGGEINLVEVIVAPESTLLGRSATTLKLRERYGINVLAVARQGQRLPRRLGKVRFVPGDILLVQGREESLSTTLSELGCLPLAERGMRLGKPRQVLLAVGIFGGALLLIALHQVAAAPALIGGALLMVLTRVLSTREAYAAIDLPVIVLLAALIPLGEALETSGGARLIAEELLIFARGASPTATLALLTAATMLLSNIVNNTAAAILTAPIALGLAEGLGISADPLLMGVAIGASCAFLTPIGHQSNTLVMEPGGYRFGDYWRMGLPLSLLVLAVAVPLIPRVWPF
jgi:di/tricarboxylate transporter